MANETTDVLISGAGAAGLALAIELARRGVAFHIIDKAPQPFHGSRGKGIQPRTLEIFEDMGIANRVAARGGFYPVQREYLANETKDEPMMASDPPTPSEPYTRPIMLPQFLTEGVMRERLAELGHHVEFGHELTAFSQSLNGVTATVNGTIVTARYLIGTDGGRSFIRQALDIGFPGNTLPVRAVVADLAMDGLTDDAWHRWNEGTAEQIGICPLRGTDLFQLQAPVPIEGDTDISLEGLRTFIATRTGRKDLVIHSVSWASLYTMNARLADRYRVDRVFLCGDAAHIHPPTGGQGLNTSIQDSYNLGWKLAAVLNGAPTSLLDTYEAERREIAAGVLGLSTKLLTAARERGDMRRGRDTHQLDLAYPDSSLSLQGAGIETTVRAGDRAPDAPCRGAGGQPLRLFDLFKGPHWTVLAYETDRSASLAPRAGIRVHRIGSEIIDNLGHIQSAYGLKPGQWLAVRPDGYVGAVMDSAETLADYFDRLGL